MENIKTAIVKESVDFDYTLPFEFMDEYEKENNVTIIRRFLTPNKENGKLMYDVEVHYIENK